MNLFLTNTIGFISKGFSMLGADAGDYDANKAWIKQVTDMITNVLWIILALVGAAGSIFAVYLGINMAKADSPEKRQEAQKRLTNVLIAVVVTIGLIIFFNTILMQIINANLGTSIE